MKLDLQTAASFHFLLTFKSENQEEGRHQSGRKSKGNSQIDACWELSDDSDVTEVENG